MKTTLLLSDPRWSTSGLTRVRGQAFDRAGSLLTASQLAARLDGLATPTQWREEIASLNGNFAAITARADATLAAVDRVRTIPLFYARTPAGFVVSDDARRVREVADGRLHNADARREFELTGYVTGDETLFAGVRQIRAGRVLDIGVGANGEPTQVPYYAYRHAELDPADVATLLAKLVDMHERVFARLVTDIGNRPIVLPLSGGYDSRLIGVALRDAGMRDVLCYTYGTEGNWESRISQDLAHHLGFRWTMVPYSVERWRAWQATPEFGDYFRYGGNLASVPHVQDWPAVFELRRRRELADGCVFVPGHTGDFIEGGHVPKWILQQPVVSRDRLHDAILGVHYSLWDSPRPEAASIRATMKSRIQAVAPATEVMSREQAADVYECWEWQERQAKFICNSLRVYDYFGYDWRVPLWDAEVMDFWSRVPVELRVGRRLYMDFVARHQTLPIARANADHAWPVRAAIGVIERLGLRGVANSARRIKRRLDWKRQYAGSGLAWFALVDRDEFRRQYTGREIVHAFMARRYLAQTALE